MTVNTAARTLTNSASSARRSPTNTARRVLPAIVGLASSVGGAAVGRQLTSRVLAGIPGGAGLGAAAFLGARHVYNRTLHPFLTRRHLNQVVSGSTNGWQDMASFGRFSEPYKSLKVSILKDYDDGTLGSLDDQSNQLYSTLSSIQRAKVAQRGNQRVYQFLDHNGRPRIVATQTGTNPLQMTHIRNQDDNHSLQRWEVHKALSAQGHRYGSGFGTRSLSDSQTGALEEVLNLPPRLITHNDPVPDDLDQRQAWIDSLRGEVATLRADLHRHRNAQSTQGET